jgi:hypothetical protein
VTLVPDFSTATVVISPAISDLYRISVVRANNLTNAQSYKNHDGFTAALTDENFDRTAMSDQTLQEQLDRSLHIQAGDGGISSVSTLLPTLVGNGGKVVAINTGETGFEYQSNAESVVDLDTLDPTGASTNDVIQFNGTAWAKTTAVTLPSTLNVTGQTTVAGIGATGNASVGGTFGVTSGVSTFGGVVSVDDTTDTSSAVTGSIHTDGGLGVAKKLYVGTGATVVGTSTLGVVNASGDTAVTSSTTSTSSTTGALKVTGGISTQENLNVGGTSIFGNVIKSDGEDDLGTYTDEWGTVYAQGFAHLAKENVASNTDVYVDQGRSGLNYGVSGEYLHHSIYSDTADTDPANSEHVTFMNVERSGNQYAAGTKAVSGITKGTSTSITATGHGYSAGDSVNLTGIVSSGSDDLADFLNNKNWTVSPTNLNTNDFEIVLKAELGNLVEQNTSALTGTWSSGGTLQKKGISADRLWFKMGRAEQAGDGGDIISVLDSVYTPSGVERPDDPLHYGSYSDMHTDFFIKKKVPSVRLYDTDGSGQLDINYQNGVGSVIATSVAGDTLRLGGDAIVIGLTLSGASGSELGTFAGDVTVDGGVINLGDGTTSTSLRIGGLSNSNRQLDFCTGDPSTLANLRHKIYMPSSTESGGTGGRGGGNLWMYTYDNSGANGKAAFKYTRFANTWDFYSGTGGTVTLALDSSQDATFAGAVDVDGNTLTVNGSLPNLTLYDTVAGTSGVLAYDASLNGLGYVVPSGECHTFTGFISNGAVTGAQIQDPSVTNTFTPTTSYSTIDSNGASGAGTCDTIVATGLVDGTIIHLRSLNGGRNITFTEVGNIVLGGSTRVLTSNRDRIGFMWDATLSEWHEIYFANNA